MYHDYFIEQLQKEEGKEALEEQAAPAQIPEETKEEIPWHHSKIRFSPDGVQVVVVESRIAMSMLERRAVWYQNDEFARISSMNRRSVKLMRDFGFEEDDCIRGLESKLQGETDRLNQIKVNSIYAVLKEQARQRREKQQDPELLARLYREHILSNVSEAHERGLADYQDTRDKPRTRTSRKSSSIAFDDLDLKELQKLDVDSDMGRFERKVAEALRDSEKSKKKKKSRLQKFGSWMSTTKSKKEKPHKSNKSGDGNELDVSTRSDKGSSKMQRSRGTVPGGPMTPPIGYSSSSFSKSYYSSCDPGATIDSSNPYGYGETTGFSERRQTSGDGVPRPRRRPARRSSM